MSTGKITKGESQAPPPRQNLAKNGERRSRQTSWRVEGRAKEVLKGGLGTGVTGPRGAGGAIAVAAGGSPGGRGPRVEGAIHSLQMRAASLNNGLALENTSPSEAKAAIPMPRNERKNAWRRRNQNTRP